MINDIGDNMLGNPNYSEKVFQQVEMNGPWQNRAYEGRLTKSATYQIAQNKGEKIFMSYYSDGRIEVWVNHVNPDGTGYSKTLTTIDEYQIGRIFEILMAQDKIVMSY